MKTNKYTGVILAAGKGSRMYPFSEDFPKPLLPICNRPLIEYQIGMMTDIGITDLIIMIGHHGSKIVHALGDGSRFGVQIKYIEQKSTLGIAHAVGLLEEHICRPFLLFLGDIFFVAKDLKGIIKEFEKEKMNCVLATKRESNKEAIKRNFAIIENKNGYVERVIEKPRHIVNDLKGCGLYFFDLHVFDAIRRTPRTAMRDEYELTDSIQILINDGFKVKKCNVVLDDINLSYPQDLLKVNLDELRRREIGVLKGKNVTLATNASVKNSVIGNNVSVENAIRLENSLIFSDTVVSHKQNIANSIVFSNKVINC